MTVRVIWWSITEKERILKARSHNGTATYKAQNEGGELKPYLLQFEDNDGHSYDVDNANPRRQGLNNLTRKEALKRAVDMTDSCETKIIAASILFKKDPSLRDLYMEVDEARFLAAALKLQKAFQEYPDPRIWLGGNSQPSLDIFEAAYDIVDAHKMTNIKVNPWVDDLRYYSQLRNNDWEELLVDRRESILFVIAGIEPVEGEEDE